VFAGNDSEQGAYLGIPTLVIIAWFALRARRSAVVRFLLATLAVAFVTLGTRLAIKGRSWSACPGRRSRGCHS
jgi:hypothetical protein